MKNTARALRVFFFLFLFFQIRLAPVARTPVGGSRPKQAKRAENPLTQSRQAKFATDAGQRDGDNSRGRDAPQANPTPSSRKAVSYTLHLHSPPGLDEAGLGRLLAGRLVRFLGLLDLGGRATTVQATTWAEAREGFGCVHTCLKRTFDVRIMKTMVQQQRPLVEIQKTRRHDGLVVLRVGYMQARYLQPATKV